LKLNRSFLEQQDATTGEIIELRQQIDRMNREHHQEMKRYKELTQQLEKKISSLSKANERIVIPSPVVTVTEVQPPKKKTVEYQGPDEIQLMADALLRIQQSVAIVEVRKTDKPLAHYISPPHSLPVCLSLCLPVLSHTG
jgi:hypothetical protein